MLDAFFKKIVFQGEHPFVSQSYRTFRDFGPSRPDIKGVLVTGEGKTSKQIYHTGPHNQDKVKAGVPEPGALKGGREAARSHEHATPAPGSSAAKERGGGQGAQHWSGSALLRGTGWAQGVWDSAGGCSSSHLLLIVTPGPPR